MASDLPRGRWKSQDRLQTDCRRPRRVVAHAFSAIQLSSAVQPGQLLSTGTSRISPSVPTRGGYSVVAVKSVYLSQIDTRTQSRRTFRQTRQLSRFPHAPDTTNNFDRAHTYSTYSPNNYLPPPCRISGTCQGVYATKSTG
jgi:hypothetical protein